LQLLFIITVHTLNFFLMKNISLHFFWFSDWSLVCYYLVRLTASQLRLTFPSPNSQLVNTRTMNLEESFTAPSSPILSVVCRCSPILLTQPLFFRTGFFI
jgi:hypothetical protein